MVLSLVPEPKPVNPLTSIAGPNPPSQPSPLPLPPSPTPSSSNSLPSSLIRTTPLLQPFAKLSIQLLIANSIMIMFMKMTLVMILLFILPATLNSLADKPRPKYLTICPILPDPDPDQGLSPGLVVVLPRRKPHPQQQPAVGLDLGIFV